jgi:hypothetical protein
MDPIISSYDGTSAFDFFSFEGERKEAITDITRKLRVTKVTTGR